MTDLRRLNRAAQSAEFPSHEWAQAVREMLNEVAERMEPASEGAKVECPNCGQPGEHYHSGDMPHVPAFYTCQPAQPEPAAPVGEMFPAMRAFLDASPVQRTIGQWHAADNELKAAHAAPPKVAMSPDLEDLLDSIMSFADVDPDTQVKQIWRRKVAAVRTQAAGVKLPPVEAIRRLLIFGSWPTGDDESYCAQKKAVIWLAELDAAEGKAETKEGK